MKTDGRSSTIAGETYASLRAMVLSGELRPGCKMRIAELQERFDVSLGTVREAVSQLISEGLVISQAHRGFTVTPVSIEDLQDLTRVRVEIENLCLSWSIERGDLEWESRVIGASHRLSRTFRANGGTVANPDWTAAHDEFHLALVSACGSDRMLQIRRQLYDKSERYRKLELSLPRNRDPESEHTRIFDSVLSRDVPAATRLMKAHICRTADNILSVMRANGAHPQKPAAKTPKTSRPRP